MSEFSFPPNNSKKTKFSSLLLSDLFLFCSFILSHPLYFSYFIFFSPYIVKVFSFLSPLFITTFLLLLALFTTLVNDNSDCPESSELKVGFLLTAYHNVLEKLRSNACDGDQEFQQLEEFEAYKIVFEASALELLEQGSALEEPVDKYTSHENHVSDQGLITSTDVNESLAEVMQSETLQVIAGGKRLQGLLKENDDEECVDEKGEKEVKALSVESNKGEEQKEETSMKSGSKAIESKISEVKMSNADHNGVVEYLSKVRSNSQRLGSDFGSNYDNGGEYSSKFKENSQPLGSNSLGSFGSMRKEKEWKRTLACKLFEERHSVNVDGGAEGMDLLWETYESDSSKVQAKSKTKKGKKGGSVYNGDGDKEDDEEEEELDDGQLCCLQALKFSAGKMNLGMGRPNLVKISKALKGFGWLHHVTKHGSKKVYP